MNIESLFSLWSRAGVVFPSFEPSREEPLVEELIARTSIIGRYEPRLLEGMARWIQKHGDIINIPLMHRHIPSGATAVIGLLCDLLDSREALKFKKLGKYCMPSPKAQMLFFAAESSPTMKAQAIENESALNRKWNLYYTSLRIKTDAVLERREILKRNPNLARRALFGTEMRTEILNYLLAEKTSFPAEISKVLGYRYHRVAEEINNLLRDGTLVCRITGKKREVGIAPSFIDYLQVTPFSAVS